MKQIDVTDLPYTVSDFEITDIFPEGWSRRKEFSLYRQNARPRCALFFVCSALEVTFFSPPHTPCTASKGDIVFIPKGICYYASVTGLSSQKVDTYTVNLDLFDKNGEVLLPCEGIAVIAKKEPQLLSAHLQNLYTAFYRAERGLATQSRNLAKTKGEMFLLLDLIAKSSKQTDEYDYPIRQGIEAFCDEWNKNEKIEKYAQLCGISVTYFYRCFRQWSGRSPVAYRNDVRLFNAESLLRCTNMQIQEIAEAVGFDDPFYFCRIFTEHFGVSPKNYRKIQHTTP